MLEAYIKEFSYYHNEKINLFINVDISKNISIKIIDKNFEIFYNNSVIAFPQKIPELSFAEGCNWNENLEIELNSFKKGLYFLKLEDKDENDWYIPFIIKEKNINNFKKNLVILNTNTWCAYNNYGGGSFYSPKNISKNKYTEKKWPNVVASIASSFLKPFKVVSDGCKHYLNKNNIGREHLFFGESILFNFLDKHNIEFDYITDKEIHYEPEFLENRKIIFLNCHPEYWTHKMFFNFANIFKITSTNLIYLGGNGIWRKILYKNNSIQKLAFPFCNEYLNIYKNHLSSDEFAEKNKLKDEPYELLGMFYDIRGYNTYHPIKFLNTSHFIFKDTNITDKETIGNENNIGDIKPSGHETDKIFHMYNKKKYDNNKTLLIGKGTNPNYGGGDIILHKFYNANIFSCGSITFTRCINNPKITKLILNVINTLSNK